MKGVGEPKRTPPVKEVGEPKRGSPNEGVVEPKRALPSEGGGRAKKGTPIFRSRIGRFGLGIGDFAVLNKVGVTALLQKFFRANGEGHLIFT